MKNNIKWLIIVSLVILFNSANFSYAQTANKYKTTNFVNSVLPIEKRDVRSHMEFLASDALQGRGSGTIYELITGKYLASQMMQFGIEPAGDTNASGEKSFIQTINISRNSFAEPPNLSYSVDGTVSVMTHGKEMIIWRLNSGSIQGKLQKLKADEKPKKGSIAFVKGEISREKIGKLIDSGAAAVIMEETPRWRRMWDRFASREVSFSGFSNAKANASTALIIVSKSAAESLSKLSDGTEIEISGKLNEPRTRQTWNAVGMIKGSDEKFSKEVILLSAHMDHIGVRENVPGKDKIYNGADDDASGCVAVLELARVLANGKRPKRTVYFVFFGSEERGGFGSRFFVNNLPFPKENFVANLQFEMIGRPDVKVGKDELWLTGYERSNLGSELAKRGAKLVKDPHPEQNFFQRSDNYSLARQGIIAHTVSSFGLHKDYHQPSDEIETIDFDYMTNAINSMVKPVQWLINTDFRPTWREGMKP